MTMAAALGRDTPPTNDPEAISRVSGALLGWLERNDPAMAERVTSDPYGPMALREGAVAVLRKLRRAELVRISPREIEPDEDVDFDVPDQVYLTVPAEGLEAALVAMLGSEDLYWEHKLWALPLLNPTNTDEEN